MRPEVTLCNELLAVEHPRLGDQARIARELGAVGLELAPGTLGDAPHRLGAREMAAIRAEIEDEGMRVTGLHWLLTAYPEASIADPARMPATADVLRGLIDLAAGLGARVLVHGSPAQRQAADPEAAAARLPAFFAPLAEAAGAAGVTYCIEPLARGETPLVNTLAEAAALVEAVGHPAFRTMIDTSAAGRTEPPVADLVARWLPTGLVSHVHLNDTARGAPGTGDDPFPDILGAVRAAAWPHPMGIEPFVLAGTARQTFEIGVATVRAGWGASA